jgi:hypothetical protein
MPYKSEKIRLPAEYNRRRKLSDKDRADIKNLWAEGAAIRALARMYDVDKRLIQFILFPERQEAAKRNRDWRDYYDKEKNTKAIREHRRYKQQLYKKGLL